MNKTAKVEGQTVTIGDWVGFKSDQEQSGKIVDIRKSYQGTMLVLESGSDCGFHGDYIGGQDTTTEMASDCWI